MISAFDKEIKNSSNYLNYLSLGNKLSDLMDEKLQEEITNINQKFDQNVAELKNISAVDEKVFKEVTSNLDDKINKIIIQFERKYKRLKDKASTTSIIPVSDSKGDDLDNLAQEVDEKFNNFWREINEEISNLKTMFNEHQGILAEVRREAEIKSRAASFNKQSSLK